MAPPNLSPSYPSHWCVPEAPTLLSLQMGEMLGASETSPELRFTSYEQAELPALHLPQRSGDSRAPACGQLLAPWQGGRAMLLALAVHRRGRVWWRIPTLGALTEEGFTKVRQLLQLYSQGTNG